jgi:sulfur carrier protein ThiS
MKIKVKILPRNSSQEIEVKKGTTISDVLRTLKLRPDAFIVLQKNTPVPEDGVLIDDQELCLVQVASGG